MKIFRHRLSTLGTLMTVFFISKEENRKNVFLKLFFLHEKISFTKEVEKIKQQPFLDILITKDKTKILTNAYRKIKLPGQYFHYQYFCSTKQKLSYEYY